MPDFIRFPLVLLIVTLISATCLALVWDVTRDRIDEQVRLKIAAGEKVVYPTGTPDEEYAKVTVEVDGATRTVEYKNVREGETHAGYIVKGAARGYSSTVEVLVGVTNSTDWSKGATMAGPCTPPA